MHNFVLLYKHAKLQCGKINVVVKTIKPVLIAIYGKHYVHIWMAIKQWQSWQCGSHGFATFPTCQSFPILCCIISPAGKQNMCYKQIHAHHVESLPEKVWLVLVGLLLVAMNLLIWPQMVQQCQLITWAITALNCPLFWYWLIGLSLSSYRWHAFPVQITTYNMHVKLNSCWYIDPPVHCMQSGTINFTLEH